MLADGLVQELESTRKFFATSTSVLEEGDSGFAPHSELYTVAGHVAHVADCMEWFIAGAFGAGWDMDFEAQVARAKAVTSLTEARAWLAKAFDDAIATIRALSDEQLMAPIPNDLIMNGAPRMAVIGGIVDHTAHHRGALTVYARHLGKISPMPYA